MQPRGAEEQQLKGVTVLVNRNGTLIIRSSPQDVDSRLISAGIRS